MDEEADIPAESQGEFIVPTKAINELNRLLSVGTIEIKFTENQVGFTLAPAAEGGLGVYIISKLVDGNYPNYRQVIPQEAQERIALPREPFAAIVDGTLTLDERIVDTAPFCWDGAWADGMLCRISTSTLVNVTAGGGSTIPTFVVEPR